MVQPPREPVVCADVVIDDSDEDNGEMSESENNGCIPKAGGSKMKTEKEMGPPIGTIVKRSVGSIVFFAPVAISIEISFFPCVVI